MSEEKTVRAIVQWWLRDHGYDGLVAGGGVCGCIVDDLMPCEEPCENCIAGYEGPDPSGDCHYKIYADKATAKAAIAVRGQKEPT